ncbi:MAG: GNAT family N-acetyltransferase [Mycobacteriaceae bacterium]|uniref:GNAT family N-acetyltransferase n=1 Tax=Corynebacterium sp. TaxID=1720 RepID=UPI003F977F0E
MATSALTDITVKRWDDLDTTEVYAIARLRSEVFLREQRVDDVELDWRDLEASTVHVFIRDGRDVVAYLRTLSSPALRNVPGVDVVRRVLGRVAVDRNYRGRGLAGRLVGRAVELHSDEPIVLHAQTYITSMYEAHGFVTYGGEYYEGGIPHVSMVRPGA